MPIDNPSGPLRLALPKGRMNEGVVRLLADSGVEVRATARGYRPSVSLDGAEAKILKPQSVIEMLHAGARDAGFAGADWVAELGAEVVELLDTGLDPVRLVAAAPSAILRDGRLPDRPLVVASEYAALTTAWMRDNAVAGRFLRSFGATEVFPPEDADCIIDNTATGATLAANGLEIVDEVMRSSTRFYANVRALDDPAKRERIDVLTTLLRAVLDARRRAMLEFNVSAGRLDAVIDGLPCMRGPTVAPLHDGAGYAVRVAAPRDRLAELIPVLKARGGSDIVVSGVSQIVA